MTYERDTQAAILRAIGALDSVRVFRNNAGVAMYHDGSRVVYGVANPGGSDLIGWRRVTITSDMVGSSIAQFLAIEVKTATGRTTGPQSAFLAAVQAFGGLAGVCRSEDDARRLVGVL